MQSGTAYAYRVRALFPDGGSSAWSESGSITPAPPGGPGGGGNPGGGGPPDPDPDTDEDTFRDSVDAYPHDSRRSRDLPTLTYAEIDISTPIIGAKSVLQVALDDTNQLAFSYSDDNNPGTPLNVILWKDGAQLGETTSYPTQGENWSFHPHYPYLNAAGEIAGTLEGHPPDRTDFGEVAFSMSVGASEPNFITEVAGRDLNASGFGWLDGLKNSGLYWGRVPVSCFRMLEIRSSPIRQAAAISISCMSMKQARRSWEIMTPPDSNITTPCGTVAHS